jgi:hypothetical protein
MDILRPNLLRSFTAVNYCNTNIRIFQLNCNPGMNRYANTGFSLYMLTKNEAAKTLFHIKFV